MRKQRRETSPVRQSSSPDDQSYTFRRSRTITGSTATCVRAAGETRGQLRSPRLHEHSLRQHRRRLFSILAGIFVVSGVLFYVISSFIGGTVSVGLQGTQSVASQLDDQTYTKLVKSYFSEHPFEQFSFAVNQAALSSYVSSRAPEVASAEVVKGDSFGSAALALKLRQPVVAWTIKSQQYFVDSDGSAFTKNYFGTPAVVVSDKSGINADAGVVASTKLLHFIGRVISHLNSSLGAASVAGIELPPNSTREVDFRLKGREYPIKADLDRDPAGQAADIVNTIKYIDSKGINPQYLDVRVEAKAYYKDK